MKKVIHISKEQINETLNTTPTSGKKSLEPFRTFSKANGLPIKIIENHQSKSTEAEIHQNEADLWCCLEGEVKFICGEELIEPWYVKKPDGTNDQDEVRGKSIRDGIEYTLKAGEWLWVPAGIPHSDSCIGTARLILIKVPDKKSAK